MDSPDVRKCYFCSKVFDTDNEIWHHMYSYCNFNPLGIAPNENNKPFISKSQDFSSKSPNLSLLNLKDVGLSSKENTCTRLSSEKNTNKVNESVLMHDKPNSFSKSSKLAKDKLFSSFHHSAPDPNFGPTASPSITNNFRETSLSSVEVPKTQVSGNNHPKLSNIKYETNILSSILELSNTRSDYRSPPLNLSAIKLDNDPSIKSYSLANSVAPAVDRPPSIKSLPKPMQHSNYESSQGELSSNVDNSFADFIPLLRRLCLTQILTLILNNDIYLNRGSEIFRSTLSLNENEQKLLNMMRIVCREELVEIMKPVFENRTLNSTGK